MKIERNEDGSGLIWLDDCEVDEYDCRSMEENYRINKIMELAAGWNLEELV